MSTAARLAAFAALLVLTFALAFGVGTAMDGGGSDDEPGRGGDPQVEPAGEPAAGHDDDDHADEGGTP